MGVVDDHVAHGHDEAPQDRAARVVGASSRAGVVACLHDQFRQVRGRRNEVDDRGTSA
jgi:hypothetical protein